MTGLVVGAAIVLLVPLSLLVLGRGVTRRDSLPAYAATRGYRYVPDAPGFCSRWDGPPFEGDGKDARNVIDGVSDGHAFVAFENSSSVGNRRWAGFGPSPRRVPGILFGVYVLTLRAALPPIEVSRAHPGMLVADAIGVEVPLAFESEDFNRAFRVVVHDHRYAYDLLSARAMGQMLALGDLSFRVEGASLIAWGPSILRPERIDVVVHALVAIADSVEAHVWTTYGGAT